MKAMGFPFVYKQGKDLLESVGEHVKIFGNRALVVADRLISELYQAKLTQALEKASIEVFFVDFSGETSPDELNRLTHICRMESCDFVIGFGGGKAQDAAKVVKKNRNIPVVIMPTIASNDAATSRIAVSYTSEGKFLGPIFLETNPEAILVDTSVIVNAPVRFLIAGIGDALATYFEAMQCKAANSDNFFHGRQLEIALTIAEKCFQLIIEDSENAVAAVKKKIVTNSVERVVEANILLSGLGFEGCGVAAAHAIAQGFTMIDELHGNLHGEEVAVALLCQLVMESRNDDYLQSILAFYARVGIPDSLRALGLSHPTEEHFRTIAKFACRENSRIFNMAGEVNTDIVIEALKKVEFLAKQFEIDDSSAKTLTLYASSPV